MSGVSYGRHAQPLPIRATQSELATNAAKYGALSVLGGVVRLSWPLEPGPPSSLVLVWQERGGPRVAAPGVAGFGSRLLSATVERQLAGHFVAEWLEDELTCRIHLPAALAMVGPQGSAPRDLPELTAEDLVVR